MAKKKRAALLARVSTPQQIKIGLESQVAVLKKRALSDEYEVPNELIFQEQISGLDAKKPIRKSLQDLMEAVEAGKVDVVYTYELTRISRDPYNLVDRMKWFTDRKIPVYIYDAEMWTLDRVTKEEQEKTTEYIFGAATYGKVEAKKMRERTMRGRNEIARDGLYVGHLSDGYCVKVTEKGKEIIVDKAREDVIKEIFTLYEQGYTVDKIADKLNLEQIPTASKYRLNSTMFKGYQETYHKKSTDVPVNRNDMKWQGAVVAAYLKNRWYIGERQFKGTPYSIPSIIKQEQWNVVSNMLKENKVVFRSNKESQKHIYLLSRLIFCGKCGKKMYGHYAGLCNHYYCSTKEEGQKCGLRGVNKENIEALVTQVIRVRGILDMYSGKQSAISGFFSISPKEEKKLKEEIKINNLEISEIEKEQDKLSSDYKEAAKESVSSTNSKERQAVYKSLMTDIEAQQLKLSNKIQRLTQTNILNTKRLNAKSNIDKIISRVVEEKNLVTLRQLFLEVLQRVTIYNLTRSVNIVRIKFVDGRTEDWIYGYQLLQQRTISLQYGFKYSDLIFYDEKENVLKCRKGKGVLIGTDFKTYDEYKRMSPSDIENLGTEGVDYLVLNDEVVQHKEFIKYCRNHRQLCLGFDRLEELSEQAKEQDARYKVWRKKYNTGLPTCVPYAVKDDTYETVSKRRKYLYNRKLKVKKHKSMSEEEKQKELKAIEEELALLKAKVKYLDRQEAVKEYRKKQEELERMAGEALE